MRNILCGRLHFKELASTHEYAMSHGSELADWAVVAADVQTKGRGRLGRTWFSPPESSILMSVVLKPDMELGRAAMMTPLLSLAVCEMLDSVGIKNSIRWPNDVLVEDKKIAGILSEASYIENELKFVVASCGINVSQDAKWLEKIDRPATSIYKETGKIFDRNELLELVLGAFKKMYLELLKTGAGTSFELWTEKMDMIGSEVAIDMGSFVIEGKVTRILPDGSIEVDDGSSVGRVVRSGEIVRFSKK